MSLIFTREANVSDLIALREWQRKECIGGRKNSYFSIAPYLFDGKMDKHHRIIVAHGDAGIEGFAFCDFNCIKLFEGEGRIAKMLATSLVTQALGQDWRSLRLVGKFQDSEDFWKEQGFVFDAKVSGDVLSAQLDLPRTPTVPSTGQKVAVVVRYYDDDFDLDYKLERRLQKEYVGEGVLNEFQEIFLPFEAICPKVTSRASVEIRVNGEVIFNEQVVSPKFQYLGARSAGDHTRFIDKIDLFTWKRLDFSGVAKW
jgi:hypothetical protein